MNKVIRHCISDVLKVALESLKASGEFIFTSFPSFTIDPTKDAKFGDVSTNVALILASELKKPPGQVAKRMVEEIQKSHSVSVETFRSVQIGGPGFINFYLGKEPLLAILHEILHLKELYGKSDFGNKQKIILEFVNANPTGPLTLAHGRQAAVGDSLARIMDFTGYDVFKEYYLNDRGRQINVLGHSVYLRYLELLGKTVSFPEDFYQGDYIRDLAQEVFEKKSDSFSKEDEKKAIEFFSQYACDRMMDGIKKDLADFGVQFDQYFSEREFVATGKVEACLEELRKRGFVYEEEGAVWLRSTDFGDDKNRVLIKSSGEMTYITPDTAYHRDKLMRGFDRVINIWGPDHHGYIPRLKAALSALGFDSDRIRVIILQLATLYEGDEKLSMSTRRGEFVTLRQVMDEVGKDVGRYFFLMRRTDSHLDFDLNLAKKHSLENPIYYIQYAHARICSIFEKVEREIGGSHQFFEKALSEIVSFESQEVEIIKKLALFQEVLEGCSIQLDPYGLTDYLLKVAQTFHQFYNRERVISDDLEKTRIRMALVKAVQIVLKNGLGLLGVNAPEQM
ncbi:MAG: arginine--tRNA ligase [Chlamydiae bacterium]|nr:arginine--tRNA ligase [Chlamydiota bacterium]MBI3276439.1 arginine--tRNA ligase [Chlamydiota bacterium]